MGKEVKLFSDDMIGYSENLRKSENLRQSTIN